MTQINGLDRIKDPELRKSLQSLGTSVQENALRQDCRRRQVPYYKPAERARRAYGGHSQEAIAAAVALAKRKSGEKDDDLPVVPSPPIQPTLEQRLIKAASETPDYRSYQQSSFDL